MLTLIANSCQVIKRADESFLRGPDESFLRGLSRSIPELPRSSLSRIFQRRLDEPMIRTGVVLLTATIATARAFDECLGEFSVCPGDGSCTMTNGTGCGVCGAGEYLCPSDQSTCVASAAAYTSCPGLAGTHLDATLGFEARLDYLVAHTSLAEQVGQLRDDAPQIERLGIAAYEWLNDDVHGVRLANATQFPNGCGLGATWSVPTMRAVGAAMALEARGAHNGFVHMGYRNDPPNGYGITMYGPNINLVHDPRWGR